MMRSPVAQKVVAMMDLAKIKRAAINPPKKSLVKPVSSNTFAVAQKLLFWLLEMLKTFSWDVAAVKPAGSDTGLPVSSKKHQKMLIWEISAFWAVFLHMSVIAPLLAFLHFVHFEGKIMSVFSREISVNTREKSVNAHTSRHKCALSSSSLHIKSVMWIFQV